MYIRSAIFSALAVGALGLVGAPTTSQADPFFNGTYDFTQSNAFGTGVFGHVTVSGTAADTTVNVDVAPNFVIDTGGHYAFTFSLVGNATLGPITPAAAAAELSFVNPAVDPGPYKNAPFQDFTNAIKSTVTNGGDGDISSFIFHVFNFQGFAAATDLFNGLKIIFAADIINKQGGTGAGQTGVVGATVSQVPLPGAIALFGSGLVGLGLLGRRRKTQNGTKAV
jgi:PEP-CTERM motif